MRNIVCLLLLFAICVLSSCKGNTVDISRLISERDSLLENSKKNQQDLENLNMFVNELSIGLDSIALQEGYIVNAREEGRKMSRAEMKELLNELSSLMARHRSRIALLEDSLKSNGTDIGKIHSLVNYLNEQLAAKEKTIKSLQAELNNSKSDIDKLQHKISTLVDNIEKKDSTLIRNTEIMNTGYVKIGTNKELIRAGITVKKVRKSKTLKPDLPENEFSKIDISKTTEFTIQSNNPVILTTMPHSSYTFINNGNGTTTLKVIDPRSFWESSIYLVIRTD